MPKTSGTRKERAKELLRLATIGPHLFMPHQTTITREQFEEQYRLWSQTWIVPELLELVPELKRDSGR